MMEEIKSIDIVTEDGSISTAKVVMFLEDEESKKQYVLYTFENDDSLESKKIYASIFSGDDNNYELLPIENEEEWNSINEKINDLAAEEEWKSVNDEIDKLTGEGE